MAKVLNPLNSSEARGRVGGLVYNTWRGIRTVKTHTDPGHQSDPKRQAHKAIVQWYGQRWSTITQAQRDAWDNFADLHPDIDWTGRPVRLAGYHWYVRIQTRCEDIGAGLDDWPPTLPCAFWILNLRATVVGTMIHILWDLPDCPEPTEHTVQIWITHAHSPGRHATIHDIYKHGYALYLALEYDIEDLPQGYYTVFARPFRNNGMVGVWASVPINLTW